MTNPYRAMCAELVDALDNLLALVNGECPSLLDGDRGGSGFLDIEIDDALTTARALLAQPEPEGPTDEELEKLVFDNYSIAISFACDSKEEAQVMISSYVKFARAVLAHWGHPTPQPMADGEVAELCVWLRNNSSGVYRPAARAADLLERLASDNVGLAAAADSLWADNVSLLDN